MKKAIIIYHFFFLTSVNLFCQINNYQNVFFKAIENRNDSKNWHYEIIYKIKSFGDSSPTELNLEIGKIKDDSFFLHRIVKNKLQNTLTYEIIDTLTYIVNNSTELSFKLYQHNRKKFSPEIGGKAHYLKRILNQYIDSSFYENVVRITDSIVYGTPCLIYTEKPFNSPVSYVYNSSIFVSKLDSTFLGYNQEEIFEGKDTVTYFSFIRASNRNLNFVRNKFKKSFDLRKQIINNSRQLPIDEIYEEENKMYSGNAKGFNFQTSVGTDSVYFNLGNGKFLLDFWFIGCYPCMVSFKFLDSLENMFVKSNIKFIKLNPIDGMDPTKFKKYTKLHQIENQNYLIHKELSSIFGVKAYPTFLFVEDGKIIKKFEGFDESVYDELKKYLEIWTAK